MGKLKIGIIDSGAGGDYIKSKLLEYNTNLDVIQAKTYHFKSFGNMSMEELKNQASRQMFFLTMEEVDIVVIGCMTLCTNCLDYISRLSKVPVYDLYSVIPNLDMGNTVVLSTKNTAKSKAFDGAIKIPCEDLAFAIENGYSDAFLKLLIREYIAPYDISHTDTVVLGCSHYSWAYSVVKLVLSPRVIIDPSEYLVAKIIKEISS